MTYTVVNPHACCNWPRPEDAHADVRQPPHPHASPHLTNNNYELFRCQGGKRLERNEGMQEGQVSRTVLCADTVGVRYEHPRHGLLVISGLERVFLLLQDLVQSCLHGGGGGKGGHVLRETTSRGLCAHT
jgi:hypothetical protein